MNRNPLGRARLIAGVSAIVVLVGCVLPWWTVGGSDGIPARTGNAFEGPGILTFIAALLTLVLVTLPFALGGRPVVVDHWLSYAVVAVLGLVGLVLRAIELASSKLDVIFPTRGPGLWLALAGLVGILWAAADMRGSEPDM